MIDWTNDLNSKMILSLCPISMIGVAQQPNNLVFIVGGKNLLTITATGRVFRCDREIESDEEFRSAMMELHGAFVYKHMIPRVEERKE